MTHVASATVVVEVGRCLRESFLMFWSTLWALVLGFTISGFVQTRFEGSRLRAALSSRRPAALSSAVGLGVASSSCSYAAASIAKSMFSTGADFIVATVFMVASTNLVVELGIVLVVLLGWQFLVAEIVGGSIMIGLLVVLGGTVFTASVIAAARSRLNAPHTGPPEHMHQSDNAVTGAGAQARPRVFSTSSVRSAVRHAASDAAMLRRELVVGYLAAGVLAVAVPSRAWASFFLHGHGLWTNVENAVVAPLIAVLSCVCSIGNVPLAGALWSKGVSFGGVVAFIFADLIALPLVFVYRRLYGAGLAVRLVVVLYALASLAGMLTDGIFALTGWIPRRHVLRIGNGHLWDPTMVLNGVFLALAVVEWWLVAGRTRFGRDGTGPRDASDALAAVVRGDGHCH